MIHQTKIMMLIFTNLCYYNDAFILVKGDITIVGNFRTQVTLVVHHSLSVSQN